MNTPPPLTPTFMRPEFVKAGAIAALYGICASIWIMGPDFFLDDDVGAERIELFLDATFVLASTLLLFLSLAHGLRRAWAERLEGGSEALLGPLPPAGAALFGESAPIDPAPIDPAPIDPAPADPTSVAPAPPGEEAAPVRELIRFPEARR